MRNERVMPDFDESLRPEAMKRLFDLGREARAADWSEREYAQLLAHQLDAPLVFAHSADGPGDGPAPAAGENAGSRIGNLRQLLTHASPPLGLLRAAKQFVKAGTQSDDHPLPRPVALVLYYGLIVAAWHQHGQAFTGLSETEVSQGVQWALRQAWLDEQLRALLQAWP